MMKFSVTGNVSIEPANSDPYSESYRDDTLYILIMGPTGVGKSSFIEALGGKACNLSISKNQLSSYTQQVTEYQLVNHESPSGNPIHVLDTPGFSDTKLSELEILDMINGWISRHASVEMGVDHILFFIPITQPRLAGSKRRTMTMLKELSLPGNVTFVTTMWDTVHTDQARARAESNFAQLSDKNGILKACYFPLITFCDTERKSQGFFAKGAKIMRFRNTQASALRIIGDSLPAGNGYLFNDNQMDFSDSKHIYLDLYCRIEGALQRKSSLQDELAQTDAMTDISLKSLLEKDLEENEEVLIKFIDQFERMGQPSAEHELDAQYQNLKDQINIMRSAALTENVEITPMFTSPPSNSASTHSSVKVQPDSPMEERQPELQPDEVAHSYQSPSDTVPAQVSLPPTKRSRLLAFKGQFQRLIKAVRSRGKQWVSWED